MPPTGVIRDYIQRDCISVELMMLPNWEFIIPPLCFTNDDCMHCSLYARGLNSVSAYLVLLSYSLERFLFAFNLCKYDSMFDIDHSNYKRN